MRMRCPSCRSVYDVEPQVLQPAHGLVRCFRCGTVFNAFQHGLDAALPADQSYPLPDQPTDGDSALQLQASDTSFLAEESLLDSRPVSAGQTPFATQVDLEPATTGPQGRQELPFEVPDDLEEIEPAEGVALDAEQVLEPTPPRRTPWWQKALLIVLLLALGAQLAWIRRDLWIDHPLAIQACAVLHCRLPEGTRPQDFHVLERNMQLVPGNSPVLRLTLAMRNDARLAQPLPQLQLSLLDPGGALVARRQFAPQQYLPPDWTGPAAALPGEVITIELNLKDPGPRARGFTIDFL